MGINEMEFHWRWKWSYRPIQRDGTTVAEYYDCFCVWKEKMVNLSCPADEGDYIDGFIDNLIWEIRLRIGPKSRSRMNRLSDAFYAAKFEEWMMFKEEAFKKIEAHILFDKMPTRIPADKFQVDVSKDSACKVFDKMAESTPAESSSFDQVLGNVNCNSAMTDKDSVAEVIDVGPLLKSEEKSCYDDIVLSNDDVAVQIEADPGKIVSPNAERKVFDKMTEPILTDSNSFPGIQLMKKAEELFPSKIEVVKVAYQVFDEMTGPVPAVVHSFSTGSLFGDEGKDDSSPIKVDNQLVVELEQLPSLKMMSLKAGHPLFDKMPEQTSVERNNEKCRLNISHLLLVPRLDTELWLGEILRFIFDPGGSSMYHMSCHSIQEQPYVASSIWCRLRNFARNIKLNGVLDFVGYVPVEVLVVYVKMGGQDKVMHYIFYSCIYWVQDKNSEAIVVSTYVEPIDAAALVIPVIPFARQNQFFAWDRTTTARLTYTDGIKGSVAAKPMVFVLGKGKEIHGCNFHEHILSHGYENHQKVIKRGFILPKSAITDGLVGLLNLQQYSVDDESGKMIKVRVFSFGF